MLFFVNFNGIEIIHHNKRPIAGYLGTPKKMSLLTGVRLLAHETSFLVEQLCLLTDYRREDFHLKSHSSAETANIERVIALNQGLRYSRSETSRKRDGGYRLTKQWAFEYRKIGTSLTSVPKIATPKLCYPYCGRGAQDHLPRTPPRRLRRGR